MRGKSTTPLRMRTTTTKMRMTSSTTTRIMRAYTIKSVSSPVQTPTIAMQIPQARHLTMTIVQWLAKLWLHASWANSKTSL